ncbi:MAG: hypothetical protein KAS49_03315 [Candidatus Cloacimonetes bacterium]|nr:hypothetical protein [Candidatus Cloacimonadota bacterium]
MKKLLIILFSLLIATSMFADFTWAQLSFYQGLNIANGWGDAHDDLYFEVEGGGRTGCLDLYYFFDVNHFVGQGDNAVGNQGNFFTKIKPRISLNKFVPKFGPVNELYIATVYKGFNGGESYWVGLGTDLQIPFIESFSANFYAVAKHIDDASDKDKTDFKKAGFVVAINWFTTLYKFNDDFNVSYQGWSDFGFANSYAEDMGAPNTADEFQMFNGFFWNYEKWSLSTSVKLHNHFMYSESTLGTHDEISYFFGLHRRF